MEKIGYDNTVPPRNGLYAESPGSYEQVFVLHNPVIQPGGQIKLEHYITGYGEIQSAKLVFYPPPEILNSEESFVWNGFKDGPGGLEWGGDKVAIRNKGFTSMFMGITFPVAHEKWNAPTMFFDIAIASPTSQPMLATETRQQRAPFEYELTTRDDILPGKYSLEFHFTYYNGSSWKTSSKKVDFQVQNWFERNEGLVKTMGVILAVIGLARAGYDFLGWILSPFF